MYQPEIIRTTEPEITILPSPILNKLEPFMQKHNIKYEIITLKDFEDGWPVYYTYKGRTSDRYSIAVKAYIKKECLHKIAEELHHVREEDI